MWLSLTLPILRLDLATGTHQPWYVNIPLLSTQYELNLWVLSEVIMSTKTAKRQEICQLTQRHLFKYFSYSRCLQENIFSIIGTQTHTITISATVLRPVKVWEKWMEGGEKCSPVYKSTTHIWVISCSEQWSIFHLHLPLCLCLSTPHSSTHKHNTVTVYAVCTFIYFVSRLNSCHNQMNQF